MKRSEAIAVFAYAFAHRKTQDFLFELAAAGFRNVIVIAAPAQTLRHHDPASYHPTGLRPAPPIDTRIVCQSLDYQYNELRHDDIDAISNLCQRNRISLGIISGARIIKKPVIELFSEGILNIHPGKIPETSGLNLFFYTIVRNVPMGCTAHFIDHRVDAGKQLFFEETPLGPEDTPEIVQQNNYSSQIRALRRFIAERDAGTLVGEPADRPRKNEPMSPDEKRRALERYPFWRTEQYLAQQGRALIAACKKNDSHTASTILDCLPGLIDFRTPEGWTPLIVSAFNGHRNIVSLLLERGADPNACGKKGTTVLMYAKTRILRGSSVDSGVLDDLVQAGADVDRCDMFGRNIFDYLAESGDVRISAQLRQWSTKL